MYQEIGGGRAITDEHNDWIGVRVVIDVATQEYICMADDLPAPRVKPVPVRVKPVQTFELLKSGNVLDQWMARHGFTPRQVGGVLGLGYSTVRHHLYEKRPLGRQTLIIMELLDRIQGDV